MKLKSQRIEAQRVKIIKKSVAEGVNSLEELCKRTHSKPRTFYQLCKTYIIGLPQNLLAYRYKPKMDAMIDKGVTLEEIGIAGGYSRTSAREGARLYILFSGQYNLWQAKRKESQSSNKLYKLCVQQVYQSLVSVLEARVAQLANNASWPEKMALRLCINKHYQHWGQLTLKKVVRLFRGYEAAQSKGKKLSLEELATISCISKYSVARTLKKVGLEPMHGYTQKRIKKANSLGLSYEDIRYFLGLKPYSRIGHGKFFTYRLYSQIYEAKGAGFSINEIAELLDISTGTIQYAINNKRQIAPKIIQAIRILYNSPHYNKPYKMSVKT